MNGELFFTLKEAEILIEQWRRDYNHLRPHSSLGGRPPAPVTIVWPNFSLADYTPRHSHENRLSHSHRKWTNEWGQVICGGLQLSSRRLSSLTASGRCHEPSLACVSPFCTTSLSPPSHPVGLIRPTDLQGSADAEDQRSEGEMPTA